ncbi:MAG TPA: 50S ribosomal protein L5 [Armatimonadota bacterium]|nr:50S ribosomal protein L5 [Armatimonadota bacterium]
MSEDIVNPEPAPKPARRTRKQAPAGASERAGGAGKSKRKAASGPAAEPQPQVKLPPRLKVRYRQEILPELMRELGLDNPMRVPRVSKVVINMGVGVATQEPKALEGAVRELAQIAGQRPAITRARKSIAAFKVREKNPVGCRVTLRGDRMYEFLDRLFNAVLPRIRDFRGLSARSFDGRGNFTMGVREQVIFPELNMDEVERVRGMDIIITTTAKSDEAGRALLARMGLPLRDN